MKFKTLTATALVLGIALSGCGGGDEKIMPEVDGKRLDVALSDIDAAGVGEDDVDVVGGGTFGIVDQSNWMVCDQTPSPGEKLGDNPRLVVDRSCGEEDSNEGKTPESAPAPAGEATEEPTTAPSTTAAPSSAAEPVAETFEMPSLVGENLQFAQDTLQDRGSYLLTQNDATGLDRFQMVDANWQVCDQKPKAGRQVSVDKMVTIDTVKIGEECP